MCRIREKHVMNSLKGNAPMRCGEGDAFSIELNWCVPYEEADC